MYSHEIGNPLTSSDERQSKPGPAIPGYRTTRLAALCVADVMTKHVVTLDPHNTFAEVVSLMAMHAFRHFLVLESPRRLVGVISDRDVLRALARTKNWQAVYTRDLMSRNVTTVRPQTELSIAANTMLEKRINCLPVLDDRGDVRGIITSSDLLKKYRDLQEQLERDSQLAASVAQNLIAAGAELVETLKR